MEIVKAEEKDISAVLKISKEQFKEFGWAPDFFEEELKKENHYFYVCKIGDEVVGFINFMQTEGENGLDFNILNVATTEKFKNQGVATRLINFVFDLAKRKNLKTVWLEVREHNFPAIYLYEKLNFKKLYVRKNYYSNGDNAIIYSAQL